MGATDTIADVSAPLHRFVEHVMGIPVSLALRGRHADDDAGRAAWAAVMAELAEVDRVFSTYRTDSVVSRLGRGEVELDDCPAEVARSWPWHGGRSRSRAGPSRSGSPTPPTRPGRGWTPAGW